MRIFKLLSALLLYPEQEMLDALPQIRHELVAIGWPGSLAVRVPASPVNPVAGADDSPAARLAPLLNYLQQHDLITLQQNYVQTFDRTPSHSLHLFEHIHGESRDRGQAMVDLLQEYQRAGWQMTANDLPDYVPLFLEFLSMLEDEAQSSRLLGDAIHVLAHIGNKLAGNKMPSSAPASGKKTDEQNTSPYACLFDVLQVLAPVTAEILSEPPVRDMDEALETFGPSSDGVEPLLNPLQKAQPVIFYPQRAHTGAHPARSA